MLYTDFWSAYAEVLPEEQHQATGKGEGQTNLIERFNNIWRQRLGRFVRQTLSFSKNDEMHDNCLRLFLHEYNQTKSNQNKNSQETNNQPAKHQPKRLTLI